MIHDPVPFLTLAELGRRIRSDALSSVGVTELMLERIGAFDDRLNAFVTVTADLALEQARRADLELAAGRDRGPLHGVPVAVKDIFATKGIRTTCGSRLFVDHVPDSDAWAVTRLQEAGAVMLGKTALHELAWGLTSINPYFGAVRNPWAPDHHPGGSSGGSAAAVAAGLAYAALGTDTGASVRQPAHCCGIVGFKPSFGRVGRTGVLPLVWTMDHVGLLTRSVQDAAWVLDAISGHDPADPYSTMHGDAGPTGSLDSSLVGTRIGVPRRYFFEGGDAEVVGLVEASLDCFRELGATVLDVEVPDLDAALRAARLTFVETLVALEGHWRERPQDLSEEIRDMLEKLSSMSAAEYAAAQHFRQEFRRRMAVVLLECDVLATPTSTVAAAPIEEQPRDHDLFSWRNTGIFNLTGQPSISVPCGFTAKGLPVGLMLSGRMQEDGRVLGVAHAYERATPWHECRPDLGGP